MASPAHVNPSPKRDRTSSLDSTSCASDPPTDSTDDRQSSRRVNKKQRSDADSRVVFKSLPSTLTTSLFYLSTHQREFVLSVGELREHVDELPFWTPQCIISRHLFGIAGVAMVDSAEAHHGCFVFATEFANVHSTFAFTEPPITIDGQLVYGGPETYFQLQKFVGTSSYAKAAVSLLQPSTTPEHAFEIGHYLSGMRADWSQVRVHIMSHGVTAKFEQHADLQQLLIDTYPHPLVQLKPDDVWGSGRDGRGRNELGRILCALRGDFIQRIALISGPK